MMTRDGWTICCRCAYPIDTVRGRRGNRAGSIAAGARVIFMTENHTDISRNSCVRILRCKLRSPETHVDHALMCGDMIWRFLCAQIMGLLGFVLRTVVEIRPVWCNDDGVLRVEKQLCRVDPCCPHTPPDQGTGIICRVPVEVATMAILPWLCWHGDLDVQVIAFAGL